MTAVETTDILISTIQELSLARKIDDIMDIVKKSARRMSEADGVTFVLRENNLCYYADEESISPLWKGLKFPMETCISGWVMINKKVAVIEDIYTDSRIPFDAYRPTFVKSLAMFPIRQKAPLGAIGIYWAHPHKASQHEIKTIQALADSTAIAIENMYAFAQLKDSNENLLLQIEENKKKTNELINAKEKAEYDAIQLQKLNATKDKLFSIIAHDLRSPFGTMLGFSELLNTNIHKYDLGKIEFQVKQINTLAEKTYNLLEDLLLWSKTQSGNVIFEPKPILFNEICDEIIDTMRESANAKNIQLQNSEQEKIVLFADINMFKTILRNLISNAIKFTPTNGLIQIYAETNEDKATIIVSDNGIGINPINIPRLWQVSSHFSTCGTEGENGTGLGLAICKEFVETHNGSIWAESELGKGSKFKFTMPLYLP